MGWMMSSDALETLRQVNDSLRSALIQLRPEQKHCATIRPQDFSDLLSEILRAAECLRLQRPHSVAGLAEAALEFDRELLEYRDNLEKLKHFLPELHGHLLAEKSRLETARNHLGSAAAWAGASKKTL
jgi:hypothetical protein